MLELEQLRYLLTFNEYETLSKAAKVLHISQPVLTRSMQKLEEDLGVSLFTRTKNRIVLNDTGKLAVNLAKRIIDDTHDMKTQLINFDKKLHTFSIGSCAPAPNTILTQKAAQIFTEKTIASEIKDKNILVNGFKDKTYTVIIMPYASDDEDIESIEFMQEQLFFSLPFDHPLSSRKSLTLKEMDGGRMLLMSNIGFWNDMHKKTMPNTKFLVQQDRTVFYDLIELSSLPSFTSDIMMNLEGVPTNRKIIPITDPDAHAVFYCWYLKNNENTLKSFLYRL